jgi:hypothetical protein
MDNTKVSTTPDGRRVEEKTSQIVLNDGSVHNVIERYEEQIPMKVTKKITQKVVSVPVEEKIEEFNDDGTVNTTIKSLTDNDLTLDKPKAVSLEDVLDQVKKLVDANQSRSENKTEEVKPVKLGFMDGLTAKFAKTETTVVVGEQESQVVTILKYCGWAAVAWLSASIVYHLVM